MGKIYSRWFHKGLDYKNIVMKNKIYVCILLVALSFSCFANEKEKPERSPKAHTLNLSYSPVVGSVWYPLSGGSWYKEWRPVPPLKFSLNYAYDIPMRSRVVNFYAIGEVSYIGAYKKDSYTYELPSGMAQGIITENLNAVILSAGMGLKFHLASFLDFSVFYTLGYFHTSHRGKDNGHPFYSGQYNGVLSHAGGRFIGKIGKINVFAGYSLSMLVMMVPRDHYIDIGIGYTF